MAPTAERSQPRRKESDMSILLQWVAFLLFLGVLGALGVSAT